ncbi:hypothetical protein Tco_1392711 [Tanacetum coccineum]
MPPQQPTSSVAAFPTACNLCGSLCISQQAPLRPSHQPATYVAAFTAANKLWQPSQQPGSLHQQLCATSVASFVAACNLRCSLEHLPQELGKPMKVSSGVKSSSRWLPVWESATRSLTPFGIPNSSQGRITPTLQYLVYNKDESNYNCYMMYKNQLYDLDNAMEMQNKVVNNDLGALTMFATHFMGEHRKGLLGSRGGRCSGNGGRGGFMDGRGCRSSRESRNVYGKVGGVKKMSSTGSKFMIRSDECLKCYDGAGGGKVNEGGDDFGVSKSLAGKIPGVVTGESGEKIFEDDGRVIRPINTYTHT